jgi:hypothetical protein
MCARLACAALLLVPFAAHAGAQSPRVNVCARSGDTLAAATIEGVAAGDHVLLPDGRIVLPGEIDSAYVALEPAKDVFARNWGQPGAKMAGKVGYVPVGLRHPAPSRGIVAAGRVGGSLLLAEPYENPKRPPSLYVLTPGCQLQWLVQVEDSGDIWNECARPGDSSLVTARELRKQRARHRRHPLPSDPPGCR